MSEYAAGKGFKIAKEQKILRAGFSIFSQRGIEAVAMPEVAEAGSVSRATLYHYFPTKIDLVVSIGTWKWEEYLEKYSLSLPQEKISAMTGAEYLWFFLDAFLDLYRNHRDILCFNYNFNTFLFNEGATAQQKQPYTDFMNNLADRFHVLYERGREDGTLNTDISEEFMLSSSFHIMLSAVTRYAVGLVYVSENATDPEEELIMLRELLLRKFTNDWRGVRDVILDSPGESMKRKGEERVLTLLQRLYSLGRDEDVKRAVVDEAFRKQLFRDFNLL